MSEPPPLPKLAVKLGWVSLLNDAATEMVYPILPLFLASGLGAPAAAIGLIEGCAEALVSVLKGTSGRWSDLSGRRAPYVQWGYGLAAASKPVLAAAPTWPLVLAARLLDRLGKGIRTTARDAMLADVIEPGQGGRVFGYHRGMDTTGAVIGVLGAWGLLQLLPHQYRTILLISTGPAILSTLLTFAVQDPPHEARPAPASGAVPWRSFPVTYWWTLAVLLVFALANSSDAFLLLRAHAEGFSDSHVILGYALYQFTYALVSYPAGVLSDRIGRWTVMAVGWLIYALVYIGFAHAPAGWLWALFAIYGIYMGITDGVGKALMVDTVPKQWKGTGLGVLHMSLGFAGLSSSVIAGLLWDHVSPAAPFWVGGVTALLAVLLIPLARNRSTRSEVV
jgi:MFS family permease